MTCPDFIPIDTTVVLDTEMTFDIYRDTRVYGDIHFRLWNPDTEQTVSGCKIEVEGYTAISDENGRVSFSIPLERQKTSYTVTASATLLDNTIYAPSGADDVLLVTGE